MATVQDILKVAQSLVGITQWSSGHKELVNLYNTQKPIPVGYKMTYSDDWCDCTVTAIFMKAAAHDLIGGECGVQRHIAIFKDKGIWVGKARPQAGDIVTFDWDSNGWADHIGIVEKVEGDTIHTIEGNTAAGGSSSCVGRHTYKWNDWRIAGYARPKYGSSGVSTKTIDELATEVINGLHGSGETRKRNLGKDYEPVQKRVNELLGSNVHESQIALKLGNHILSKATLDKILAVCKHYNILPSYAITVLHFEGLWGNSNTGKQDNNWGGMTWTGDGHRPSGVVVTQGAARPSSEGGHYMHYATVDDFLKDWAHLLRQGGLYKVSGAKSFEQAVKGMFKVGGASADYAAAGYNKYIVGMASRLKDIEQANGSLSKYDDGFKATQNEIVVSKINHVVLIDGVKYVREDSK